MRQLLLLALSIPCFAQMKRELHFTRPVSAENVTDVAAAVRSLLGMDNVVPGDASIAVRGTYAQISAAECLIANFEESAAIRDRSSHECRVQGSGDFIRVFYLDASLNAEAAEERVPLFLTIAGVRKAITYNSPRAVAVRGSREQIASCEWLLEELARGPSENFREYRVPAGASDLIRIFYSGDFRNITARRKGVRAFAMTSPKALVLRGPYGQVTQP